MKTITEFHNKAMELTDLAFFSKRKGQIDEANQFLRQALEYETRAANNLKENLKTEPTRSILYRSAASLAIDCEEFREAERLISIGLSGEPPDEIADDLRNLLEQAHFSRHLKIQNVNLSSGEFQLSIAGNAVGYGVTLTESLIERIKDLERLIYRTVERLQGLDFRERGSSKKNIVNDYSLYMSAPRAGSFAVTLRLGKQMSLPGFDLSDKVIDELLECFELINEGAQEKLKEKIPTEPYFQNFIGLAKRIAPDGEKISLVGLTRRRGDSEVGVAIRKTSTELSKAILNSSSEEKEVDKTIQVRGRLLFADARKASGKIQLVESSGISHDISVPEGMMDDIVKPLWDEIVVVSGVRQKSKILLKEISRAE